MPDQSVPDTSLPEQAAESSPTSSMGMNPHGPSSGIPTPVKYCASDSPGCTLLKGMSGTWTSADWLRSMRSAADSLARTSALLARGGGSPESGADSTASSSGQSTIFDLPGCSWKTAQPSEPVVDMSSSGTLWRQDIPGATASLERLMSVRPTAEIAGGYLPTVTATTAKQGAGSCAGGQSRGRPLLHKAAMSWPTPLASDWKSHSPAKKATNSRPFREQAGASDGGPLNPAWVEWLMGWPIGHTASSALATGKSRSARRSRGGSSGGR
jgi:hypothetical protein